MLVAAMLPEVTTELPPPLYHHLLKDRSASGAEEGQAIVHTRQILDGQAGSVVEEAAVEESTARALGGIMGGLVT